MTCVMILSRSRYQYSFVVTLEAGVMISITSTRSWTKVVRSRPISIFPYTPQIWLLPLNLNVRLSSTSSSYPERLSSPSLHFIPYIPSPLLSLASSFHTSPLSSPYPKMASLGLRRFARAPVVCIAASSSQARDIVSIALPPHRQHYCKPMLPIDALCTLTCTVD